MVYYGYRYYSAELGRWINRDPIGDVGSIKLFWNMEFVDFAEEPLYIYVLNSPINQIDPHGLSSFWDSHRHFYPENYSDDSPLEKQRIRERIRKEQIKKKFLEWYNKEKKNTGWMNDDNFPNCPDKLCMKGEDAYIPDRPEWKKYWNTIENPGPGHSGHTFMIISNTINGLHGQQCTYDGGGNLIKEGFAAGTADYYNSRDLSTWARHMKEDFVPFSWAAVLDDGDFGVYNKMYAEVREINQGGGAKLEKEDCCDNGPELEETGE